MLLVVDVGNTQTHFGAFEGEELVEHWRFATVRESTADELGAALSNLLELRGYGFGDLRASIVSSTVPRLEPEWTAMAERYLGHEMHAVGPGTRTGMAIRYDNPREIGADRLVNAVAIRERFSGLAVCVDFGTATTFDVVDDAGNYRGGVIAPGINLSLQALQQAAAKLPSVAIRATAKVIGTNTVACMQSGIYWGYVGLIEGIVTRITKEYGAPMRVIATGGLAPVFEHASPLIERVDGTLNLWGMRLVYERNRPKTIAV
jgi:type III pantothenate kinase